MNSVHFVLQGKGGVGKSFVAVLIAQYLKGKSSNVICADTDPVNATFTQYESLDVAHVEIVENGNVTQRKFDALIEQIVKVDYADVIIDNGAATFLPLTRYIAENDIYKILAEYGKTVYVHTILTGGQAKTDTFNGFAELVKHIEADAKVVVWLNEFWGAVSYDGHPITATKLYKEASNAGKIAGTVRILNRGASDTFTGDIKQMLESHMTLNDVMDSDEFGLLSKNRLRKVVSDVFDELNSIKW